MNLDKLYDVIIIGGSISGLSAAMTLGRSLRNVLVIDSGKPCNRFTPHSHNFLTQDGSTPAEIIKIAKEQISRYETVEFLNAEVLNLVKTDEIFHVELNHSNEILTAKKILFATGLTDILPEIEGLKECWGISAIHCPYCHGYEFRQKKTGILANEEKAIHLAKLAKNLTSDVTIFTNGKAEFTEEQYDCLNSDKIKFIEQPIQKVEHENGNLKGIYIDDEFIALDALYVKTDLIQSSNIPEKLGCEMNEHGLITVDILQRTNIKGVFASGDNSSPFRAVSAAASAGNIAGASINMELCI